MAPYTQISSDFKAEYRNKFGNVSQIAYAGNAYDTVMMMDKVNLTNKDTIVAGFAKINGFNGVLGKYAYSEGAGDRYLASPVHIKLINGGEIEAIK
mgnify:FL=1